MRRTSVTIHPSCGSIGAFLAACDAAVEAGADAVLAAGHLPADRSVAGGDRTPDNDHGRQLSWAVLAGAAQQRYGRSVTVGVDTDTAGGEDLRAATTLATAGPSIIRTGTEASAPGATVVRRDDPDWNHLDQREGETPEELAARIRSGAEA